MQLNEVVEDNKNGYKNTLCYCIRNCFLSALIAIMWWGTSLYIILHYSIYIGFWKPMIKYTQT